MKQLDVNCRICGRQGVIQYEPNDVFSETFCVGSYVCDPCKDRMDKPPKPGNQLPDREFKQSVNRRLPYADA